VDLSDENQKQIRTTKQTGARVPSFYASSSRFTEGISSGEEKRK
jgi:hypothetical protein